MARSRGPNLQNISPRTELGRKVRQTFFPRAVESTADYSQVEVRLAARMAEEKKHKE